MSTLERYIDQFGPVVGPKVLHLEKSRAAYKGVSTRRRSQIELVTGKPFRKRKPTIRPVSSPDSMPLFPETAETAIGE